MTLGSAYHVPLDMDMDPRLDDPDPHIRDLTMIALLDDAFAPSCSGGRSRV